MKIANACDALLNRVRVLCCALAIVAGAAFATTVLAPPCEAYAASDVYTIKQSDFSNGACMLSVASSKQKGYYKLGEDVTGRIYIVTNKELELDLNGHTVTAEEETSTDYGAIVVANQGDTSGATITIKNGMVVQEGTTMVNGIEVVQDNAKVTLENLTVSVADGDCVYQRGNGASTTIRGGSYTAKNTADYTMYVLNVMAGSMTVEQTDDKSDPAFTITADDEEDPDILSKASSATVTLKAGEFSGFPSGASVAEGYAVYKSSAKNSTWNVMTEDDAREASLDDGTIGWSVAVDGFGTVYFNSETEAKAFAEERDSTAVAVVVARVGETYYASLQAAVNAAGSDDTVLLVADTTEGITIKKGKSVNINLGGKTLTAPDSDEAIDKSGYGTVNISNGTIVSKASCIIVDSNATSATITLEGVDATSTSTSAINCLAGTLNVKGGTIFGTSASNGYAIAMGSDARVNVSGGSLTGGTGVDISRGTANHLTVSGGNFSSVVNVADYLASGCSLQYKSGRYYVVDSSTDKAAEALKAKCRWVLTTNNGNKVYYDENDESQANADNAKLSGSTLAYIYRVTFNDYKGDLVETRGRTADEALGELPYQGTREDYGFDGWYNGDDEATETTTVSSDVIYTATWKCRGAAKIGETYYSTLQQALDAAKSGETIVVLQNISGEFEVNNSSAGNFTLDLNGHTVSHVGYSYHFLRIRVKTNLTIVGGTIESRAYSDDRCVQIDTWEANLTLRDVTLSSSGYGVVMSRDGGTLTVGSGAVLKTDSNPITSYKASVNIEDGAKIYGTPWTYVTTLTVSGGWFSAGIIDERGLNTNNITGGSFGNNTNKDDVADGYVMEGPNADGRYTVVKDTAAPVISGIEEDGVYEGTMTFTVADDSSVTVTVGNVTLTAGEDGAYTLSEETLVGVSEGALTVTATDAAGNSSSDDISWYKGHAWSAWADAKDGKEHARTCSHCGQTETEAHSGGTATCVAAATCEKCGATYGSTDATNHAGTEQGAWTTSDTQHWHACSACNEAWGEKADHTFTWVVDKQATYTEKGTKHEECTVCGLKRNEGTEIDKLDPGAPVICGLVNGDCYDGDKTFTVTYAGSDLVVKANGVVLDANADGSYTLPHGDSAAITVIASGAGHEDSVTVHSYASHAWGEWQAKADGTHVRACTHEGCSGTESGKCAGDAATCVSASVCEDCGYQLAPVDPSNHVGTISSDWESDDEGHWHVCDACQGKVDEAEHTLEQKSDAEGHWNECSECGYETEHVTHALTWVTDKEATATEDGLKHEECSECGYETGNTEVIPHTGDDKGDDSGDKGGSDDKGGDKDGASEDGAVIPQTGDPAAIVSGIAAAGAALAGFGACRRRK